MNIQKFGIVSNPQQRGKYAPVKLGFIILSIIGVLQIPEEFYLYKDKDKDHQSVCTEHGNTLIIKRLNDKESVLHSVIYHKKQKYFLAIFFFSFATCWRRNN
jgi:hypothetical protein